MRRRLAQSALGSAAIYPSPRATVPSSRAGDDLHFPRIGALELELITLSQSPLPDKNSGSMFASGVNV